ncbi:hypothetical protein [Crocosphaera sp.]|uniref:hypothetical protein n=1 Tax=Crocosphaera sp. TaxID=2729996 RepID=UPI003F2842DB
MKENYDFSQGKQGKFYDPNAVFQCSVYLEPDVNEFMTKLAQEKGVEVEILVNELLRNQIKTFDTIK